MYEYYPGPLNKLGSVLTRKPIPVAIDGWFTMAKDYCMHGCYPVDKKWHGGSFKLSEGDIQDILGVSPGGLESRMGSEFYKGKGDLVIKDIFVFRRLVDEFGPETGEELLKAKKPNGEPYIRGAIGRDDEPIEDKKKKRKISISTVGQGPEMSAYLDMVDKLSTHYKFETVSKVKDAFWATPESQVHQEISQRRQQIEQQLGRTLSNLSDLYEEKQLLEHDMRKLEARLGHVKAYEESTSKSAGKGKDGDDSGGYEGYEDELKADFVDLVDQHVGRHSILQMQANDVFPSITADFYSMTGLEDLQSGHLKNLPENEKAVLRKKWKLYQQWKQQFQTAVRSRYEDVKRRLNSVLTSIEQTEKWVRPYVQDMQQITSDYEMQLDTAHGLGTYLAIGNANVYRAMKVIGAKDMSPGQKTDLYYDVVIMHGTNGSLPSMENPQAAGQGLALFAVSFEELLCCKHVYEAVFQAQVDEEKERVKEYIKKYIGETGPLVTQEELDEKKAELQDRFNTGKGFGKKLGDDEESMIEHADTMDELERIETRLDWKHNRPSVVGRLKNNVRQFFGATDDFFHPNPTELRRELIGPGFPTQFYLDYKYSNDLFVMK